MGTLYELTEEFMALLEMAEDPDVDAEAFKDTLEGLEGEIEYKADGYAKVIKQLESYSASCASEIKRLQAKKKTYENNILNMKKHLETAMVATGKTKFKTELFSFGIQKNPASLIIDNEADVPPEYLVVRPEINKDAIKEAIKNGSTFEFAHLEQSESLRIR